MDLTSGKTDDRHAGAIGLAFLLVVTVAHRMSDFRAAFVDGEAVGVGDGDAAYHLRRILQAVGDFPWVASFDPLMNWPQGGACPWADGFDVLGAGFALLTGGARSAEAAAIAALLWPVVLSLLAIWATIDLARLMTPEDDGPFAPLAAGLLVAFMPGFAVYGMFGFTDHHVFEQLMVVLLCGWALRRFTIRGSRRASFAWEASGALLCGIALWGFNGSVLYCGLVAAVLLGTAVSEHPRPHFAGSGAPALIIGALLGGILTIPAIRGHGLWLSFRYPSFLQSGLLCLAGVSLAIVVGAARWAGPGRQARRAMLSSGILVLVTVLVLAAVPAFGREVFEAVDGWLLHRDPWLATVEEFQPLSRLPTSPPGLFGAAMFVFGVAGWMLPLSLIVSTREAARSSWPRALAFLWFTATMAVLTLVSVRFGRVATPLVAVATALTFGAVGRALGSSSMRRILPLVGAAAFLVLGRVWAVGLQRSRFATNTASWHAVHSAAREVYWAGPGTGGEAVGVLAPWHWGHHISASSARPVVVNGFGSYLDRKAFSDVEEAYRGDEDHLVALMDRRQLGIAMGGFLVLSSLRSPSSGAALDGDPARWLPTFLDGHELAALLFAGSGIPDRSVPHLSRLLPRFCARQSAETLENPVPLVCTFDRVKGADIQGVAEPGTRVVGEIDLFLRGSTTRYRAWADAGPDGKWSMRIALPSNYARGPLRSGPRWRLTPSPGVQVDVDVPEAAVRGGEEIPIEASRSPASRGGGTTWK